MGQLLATPTFGLSYDAFLSFAHHVKFSVDRHAIRLRGLKHLPRNSFYGIFALIRRAVHYFGSTCSGAVVSPAAGKLWFSWLHLTVGFA